MYDIALFSALQKGTSNYKKLMSRKPKLDNKLRKLIFKMLTHHKDIMPFRCNKDCIWILKKWYKTYWPPRTYKLSMIEIKIFGVQCFLPVIIFTLIIKNLFFSRKKNSDKISVFIHQSLLLTILLLKGLVHFTFWKYFIWVNTFMTNTFIILTYQLILRPASRNLSVEQICLVALR